LVLLEEVLVAELVEGGDGQRDRIATGVAAGTAAGGAVGGTVVVALTSFVISASAAGGEADRQCGHGDRGGDGAPGGLHCVTPLSHGGGPPVSVPETLRESALTG